MEVQKILVYTKMTTKACGINVKQYLKHANADTPNIPLAIIVLICSVGIFVIGFILLIPRYSPQQSIPAKALVKQNSWTVIPFLAIILKMEATVTEPIQYRLMKRIPLGLLFYSFYSLGSSNVSFSG